MTSRSSTLRLATVAALAVALGACGTQAPATAPGGNGSPTQAPGGSGIGASIEPGGSQPAASGTPGGMAPWTAGLEGRESYAATATIAFDGGARGTAAAWSTTVTLRVAAHGERRRIDVQHGGVAPDDPGQPFHAFVDGVAYELDDAGACDIAGASDDGPSILPEDLLVGWVGGSDLGSRTIEGVDAVGLGLDDAAVAGTGLSHASGEVWTAREGGYVVSYSLRATAGEAYLGEPTEGVLTIEYRVTAIVGDAGLVLPEDCPPGHTGAPRLPDAGEVIDVPGFLSYTTASTVGDVLEFYQAQAASVGWTDPSEPQTAAGGGAMEFRQGRWIVTVEAATSDGSTTVTVLVGAADTP